MKLRIRLFALLLTLFSCNLRAQEQPNTIKVSARAIHLDATPLFKATVSLSGTYSSLPPEMVTLEKLKKQYKDALEAKNIAWNDLKENPNVFGYETLRYEKEGTLYEFRTESVDKMKKFLQVKSLGVQVLNYDAIVTVDDDEITQLSKKALSNATERATAIAQAMGKQLGEVKEVEDLNNRWGEEIVSTIYYDRDPGEYIYIINVIFTVK
ncbi:SIMPL domain-containing protein [Maribacter sp. 2-571]|uniref:SIMPL domain-containing protein n=1 Tax=Maribacter sp. 2-571 TaxID=3417569 RepID=UPI003D32A6D8